MSVFDMQISRRGALGLGGSAALAALLVACTPGSPPVPTGPAAGPNVNPTGFPIVKDPITVEFLTAKGVTTTADYNQVANWAKYQQMTNMTIDWGLVPAADVREKVALAMASGDYPEVLWGASQTTNEVARYAAGGQLLPFNDLIDQYMPNLKRILDASPAIRAGMTFPDGKIYGLPLIQDENFVGLRYSQRLWLRKDWLDRVGLDVPETTEDLLTYLREVTKAAPNGAGQSFGTGDLTLIGLEYFLSGAYGVLNRGLQHPNVDSDPDTDDVRFYRTTDAYRELIDYQRKIFAEGLVPADVFSKDFSNYSREVAAGYYGSIIAIDPVTSYGTADDYVSTRMLTGPDGQHSFNSMRHPLMSVTNFLMTNNNEHQVETARWADYFYSDEGGILFFLGVEGESWEKLPDGTLDYVPAIRDNPSEFAANVRPYVTYPGAGYPGIVKQSYFKGAEGNARSQTAGELLAPDALTDPWPEFTYTTAEADEIRPFITDATTYMTENRAQFITGRRPMSEWSDYVDTLNKMGVDGYLEVERAALARYRKG